MEGQVHQKEGSDHWREVIRGVRSGEWATRSVALDASSEGTDRHLAPRGS